MIVPLGVLTADRALAQEIDPAAEEAFFVGVALLEAGDPSGAIAKFDQALRIDRQLRRVHFYRAQAWSTLGDIAEARADLDAYGAFSLSDAERRQLDELRGRIDARAEQIGSAEARPPGQTRPREDADATTTGPDGVSILRTAEEELARGDCVKAAESAQAALTADNTLSRAFLIKGLALECQGEGERALTVIGMYEELRAGQPADPVATAAKARIEAALGGSAAGPAAPSGPSWSVVGEDPRIDGVLGQQWGTPMAQALQVRTRRTLVPGVGRVDVGQPRMSLGGSTTRVERAWAGDDGLLWTRLRVFERSGIETTGWFTRSFAELYREVEAAAGPPDHNAGLLGAPEQAEGASWALKGVRRLQVEWKDGDGDRILLRIGRCTVTGDASVVHPANAPCVELIAWSGEWNPGAERDDPAAIAARRIEAPGRLQIDVSGGAGFGFGPSVWALDYRNNTTGAFGGELGLDLNLRVAIGPAVFGVGWALSLAGYTDIVNASGPFVDNRVMGYIGFRDRPRQRSMADVMLGFGLVPEAQGTAFAGSFRVLAQARTAQVGRFFVSFEPYFVVGTDITIVPMRFVLGGLVGTKQRPVRER
jgi:hypothetical protein